MTADAIRVNEPRELLAYIPFQLGFRPRESVVLVSLRPGQGTSHETGLVIRVDTADLADPMHGADLAEVLTEHLLDDGADAVFVVAYDAGEEWRQARERLVLALHGVGRVSLWYVDRAGYGHDECTEGCCPRPLSELQSTQVGATMVLDGAMVAARREDLAVPPAPAGPRRVAAWEAFAQESGSAHGPGAAARRRAGAALWDRAARQAREGQPVSGADLGRLLAHLGDRRLRDAALARMLVPTAGPATADYLDDGAVVTAFGAAGSPERRWVMAGRSLLWEVAAHAPVGEAAPALGALAFLAWWTGDGARADVVAAQCLAEDPTHRLAWMVVDALAVGMPPPWANQHPAGRGDFG